MKEANRRSARRAAFVKTRWARAERRVPQVGLVKAAIADDATELTKLATGNAEMALAKSDAARFKVGDRGDNVLAVACATTELSDTLRSLVEKRNERLYGLGALAKRSMRFCDEACKLERSILATPAFTHDGLAGRGLDLSAYLPFAFSPSFIRRGPKFSALEAAGAMAKGEGW
jgi:hypothetical protein